MFCKTWTSNQDGHLHITKWSDGPLKLIAHWESHLLLIWMFGSLFWLSLFSCLNANQMVLPKKLGNRMTKNLQKMGLDGKIYFKNLKFMGASFYFHFFLMGVWWVRKWSQFAEQKALWFRWCYLLHWRLVTKKSICLFSCLSDLYQFWSWPRKSF